MKFLFILLQLIYASSYNLTKDENTKMIANGVPYNRDEYPFVMLLINILGGSRMVTCTGSLIADLFVLTAAHCEPSDTLEHFKIYQGNLKFNIFRKAQEFIAHPNYNGSNQSADLAMIKLEKPFDNIKRFSILYNGDTTEFRNNKQIQCIAVGFGKIPQDQFNNDGHITTFTVGWGKYACTPGHFYLQWEESLCSLNQTNKTCSGDSGGPLYCNGYQYGIASTAYSFISEDTLDCGGVNVNTRHIFVHTYKKWILSFLNPKAQKKKDPSKKNSANTITSFYVMLIMISLTVLHRSMTFIYNI